MSDDDLSTAVDSEIAALGAPLRARVSELDALIAERTSELAKLRETRSKAMKALVFVDPSSAPVKTPKKTDPAARVSADTVAAVEKRLHDMAGEVNGNGGFTVTSLRRDHGFGDMSQSTLAKILVVLRERELIRLDHRGRGGAHYFKVVA